MAHSSSTQAKLCSNLSGKVRVVARIRGFTEHELAFDPARTSVISIVKSVDEGSSEKIKLLFDDQISSRKNEYEMDNCYQQNEDTALIFSKEIKPYISRVFDGENSTFIAFGARGSGKTYTIQGSEENLGLGMLAMDEILKTVEGGEHAVAISIYEIFQDRVFDLLDVKNPEVRVLEDARGKIMLKGLSKLHVKSMLEFQKLYCSASNPNKPTQKITLELPRRSHKALMIHILASDEGAKEKCVGKMNFVDLAGYENARRNSIDGTRFVESTRINKSLNALVNVIHAVNANETRVPYRESKIARLLQDSLGGNNHISMLVCLNPSFCPDTVHAVTLASRLKNIKPVALCSTAKKQVNPRVPLAGNKVDLVVGVFSTGKKQTNPRVPLSAKKINVIKGRNLFGGIEQTNGFKDQASRMANKPSKVLKSNIPNGDSTVVVPYVKEEKCSSNVALFNSDSVNVAAAIEVPSSSGTEAGASIVIKQEDGSVKTQNSFTELIPRVNGDNVEKENLTLLINEGLSSPLSVDSEQLSDNWTIVKHEDAPVNTQSNHTELIPHVNGENIKRENNNLLVKEAPSPPLSVKLKQLSDNLKSLCSSTPLPISRPQEPNTEVGKFIDSVEPRTPIVSHKMDLSNCPSGSFSKRSTGVKQSFAQDYLQFLNTASKDDLKGTWGIGEKRASYILELREESPQPFKSLDDLKEIGLSAKQVKKMMKNVAGELFS